MGALPSDTENNPQVNAVTLRNGRELEEVPKKRKDKPIPEGELIPKAIHESKKNDTGSDPVEAARPPPPFPQRLQKKNDDYTFNKFLSMLSQVQLNIPLVDVLHEIPKYAKYIKDIVAHKRKLTEFETIALTEECTSRVQNKLPQKLKDPGSFTIPVRIGNIDVGRALCDLGTSINLMPLSLFKKLGLGAPRSTTVMLQLADRSIAYPEGVIEDGIHPFEPLKNPSGSPPKPSIEEAPKLELKPLPPHFQYAYLGSSDTLPVIVSSDLSKLQEEKLLRVLREHKRAIGWTMSDIKDYMNFIASGVTPPELTLNNRRRFLHDVRLYMWDDPFLYRQCADQLVQRCVPKEEMNAILHDCHASPYGGHHGGDRTAQKVLQSGFYWLKLFKDAHAFVKKYDVCQRTETITKKHEMPNILAVELFDVWGIDFMGPFPHSNGHKYILVASDYISN
ncbi:uncharacterized protein [Nicotiana tomentosiformis]|uniref:uncharacterized protein n=1 Tax=Nicotiana tomentosiformis TaxID=4098 RepID=UPI00388CDC48